jgi:hypothetical protein
MKLTVGLVLAMLAAPWGAKANESTFCGRSLGHEGIRDVVVPCPANAVCFGVWYRWQLVVDDVIAGSELPKQVSAAMLQHGSFTSEYEAGLQVFVVQSIDDEEKRKLLGADFILLRHARDNDQQAKDRCLRRGS